MKYITLTQNKQALVDDDDFEWLSQWKWYYHKGYAVRNEWVGDRQRTLFMHRFINKTPNGMDTDHRNRDKLDNQRRNLRTCSRPQNTANTGVRSTNTTGHKGVTWHKRDRKWRAQINKNGKRTWLGSFDDIEQAIDAYRQASLDCFGEYAL